MSLEYYEAPSPTQTTKINDSYEAPSPTELELFYEKYCHESYEEEVGEERIAYPHKVISGVIDTESGKRIIVWRSTHPEHASMNLDEAKHMICSYDDTEGERRFAVTDFTQLYRVARGFDPGANIIRATASYLAWNDGDPSKTSATLEIHSTGDATWREQGINHQLQRDQASNL